MVAHKLHSHGQGKFRHWSKCDNPLCKAQPIDKKIRENKKRKV